MTDSLLSSARAFGDGQGLELWRKLHAKWGGAATQMAAAKARDFQDPQRCNIIQQFCDALLLWEQLGSEATLGGYAIPDWVRAQALGKLAPDELVRTIVALLAVMARSSCGDTVLAS